MNDAGETVPALESAAIRIRRAQARDLAGVVALDARVTGLAKPDYWETMFRRFAGRARDRFFFVAEPADADRVLGFIVGEIRAWEFGSTPCGWVFAVSVDPDMRLAGVGSRLLATLADGFRHAGVDRMRTMLSRGNQVLMSFFRSQGMTAGPYIELEMDLD